MTDDIIDILIHVFAFGALWYSFWTVWIWVADWRERRRRTGR
jgi:hypothetical protein